MKYMVEITEDVQVELDVTVGAPPLTQVTLEWVARDGVHMRELLSEVGGGLDGWHLEPVSDRAYRFGVPLTRDGESVGAATVVVKLMCARLPRPQYPEIVALIAERDAAKAAG